MKCINGEVAWIFYFKNYRTISNLNTGICLNSFKIPVTYPSWTGPSMGQPQASDLGFSLLNRGIVCASFDTGVSHFDVPSPLVCPQKTAKIQDLVHDCHAFLPTDRSVGSSGTHGGDWPHPDREVPQEGPPRAPTTWWWFFQLAFTHLWAHLASVPLLVNMAHYLTCWDQKPPWLMPPPSPSTFCALRH